MSGEDRLSRVERIVEKLVEVALRRRRAHGCAGGSTANSDAKIAALTDAQIRTEESLARLSDAQVRTEEALVRLATAQAHTDQRLDALIDIVRTRLGGA
jgi:hypothetical protein